MFYNGRTGMDMKNKLMSYKQLKEIVDKDPIIRAIAQKRVKEVDKIMKDLEKLFGKSRIKKKFK